MGSVCYLLPVAVILLLSNIVGGARNSRWFCDLQLEPEVVMVWNSDERSYVLWDGNTTTTDNESQSPNQGTRRRTNEEQYIGSTSFLRRVEASEEAISVSRQAQKNNNDTSIDSNAANDGNEIIIARRCFCWDPTGKEDKDFFCPLPRSHCGIGTSFYNQPQPSSSSIEKIDNPACLDVKRGQVFAQHVWPIVVVW